MIELMRRAAALVTAIIASAAAAGCDGSAALTPDVGSPEVTPFVPGPNLVTLTVGFDEPFYMRYRDGEGPWTAPRRSQPNTYELHVTDAYDVVALCGGLRDFDSEMLKRTFADGANAFMFCYASPSFPDPPPGNVWEVTGTMMQAGEVSFGSWDFSPFGPWSFSFDVREGTHDLIAISDTHMLIRRGVAITADTTLPRIDTELDGEPLGTFPFVTNAEAGVDTVRSWIELETAAAFATITGSATALRTPPGAILAPGDRVDVEISASTSGTYRGLRMPFTGAESNFILPAKIGSANVEYTYPYRQLWATWQNLPRFTELALTVYSLTAPTRQRVSVSERYLKATRTSYLSFYPMPYDYDQRFTVDVVGPYLRAFTAYDLSQPDSFRFTSADEAVNLP